MVSTKTFKQQKRQKTSIFLDRGCIQISADSIPSEGFRWKYHPVVVGEHVHRTASSLEFLGSTMILRSSRKEHKPIQTNRKPCPQTAQTHSVAAVPSSLAKIKYPQPINNANQFLSTLHSNQQALSKKISRRKSIHSRRDRRQNSPHEYPDLDFHHTFGSFLTRRNPISRSVNSEIAAYWDLLNKSPAMLQHHIDDIGDGYRESFREFFTAEPISLHGHVSDASNAALLTSLLSHLVSHASPDSRGSIFGEGDKENPQLAITSGSYGAVYGCLAHDAVMESVRTLGNGPRPVIVQSNCAATIDAQVQDAKRLGCIALITEVVRARDGQSVSTHAWKGLLRACKKYGLPLIVDEALTSIRCGAPFAYQLPQYSRYGFPDLVLFGKAVRTNGVAVEWRGVNVQKLGITDPEERAFTILDWQENFTEMAQAADLLTSWGTLTLAKREKWPQRAQAVGRVLRDIIASSGIKEARVGGLHGLIYLRLVDIARLSPVMGAKAGKLVRWFPTLDTTLTSEKELRTKVFGAGSISHRREFSAYLRKHDIRLRFCSRCGDAVDADVKSCDVCVVRVCEECEPGEHVCPMDGLK